MEPKTRKLQILSAIVESYAETGEPVGSKVLAELLNNQVSTATLRNDMAALAESGYLSQPHTSAGRIPTQRGYRMYVDQLMNWRTLPEDIMRQIDIRLTDYSMDPDRFLTGAAHMLSEITGMAAVISAPSTEDALITGMELMPTGMHTCLLVIMLSPSVLKTRRCRITLPFTDDMLEGLRRMLKMSFIGKRLSEIDRRAMLAIQEQLGPLGTVVEPILLAVRDTARNGSDAGVIIDGQAHLLERSMFSNDALRGLMVFICDPKRVGRLFSDKHGTISVLIGSETGVDALSEASVVKARYSSGLGASGWVGVIGPQRMSYSKLIPSIQYFAGAVSKVMSAVETESGTLDGEDF